MHDKRSYRLRLILSALAMGSILGCGDEPPEEDPEPIVVENNTIPSEPTFSNVAEIYRQNCAVGSCHGNRGAGDFFVLNGIFASDADVRYGLEGVESSLTGRKLIEPGNAAQSEFYIRMSAEELTEVMPPGSPIRKGEIELVKKWIDAGASYLE